METFRKDDLELKAGLTINFKTLFMELLDKTVLILLISILAGLLGYILYNHVLLPDYDSTTKIYILPNASSQVSYMDLEVGSQLTNDYAQIIQGRDVVEETIEFYHLDIDYDDFVKKVLTVENEEDTRILAITIRDKDPMMARQMAVFVRDKAVDHIESNMAVNGITVVEEANLPSKPVFYPFVIALLLAIIAYAISTIVVIIRYLVIDRVVTAEDIETRLGLTVLGAITYEENKRAIITKDRFFQRKKG